MLGTRETKENNKNISVRIPKIWTQDLLNMIHECWLLDSDTWWPACEGRRRIMISTMQEVIVSYAARWVHLVLHEQKNKKLLKYIHINISCRTNVILNCHSTNHSSRYWQCHLINYRKIHLHVLCSSNAAWV